MTDQERDFGHGLSRLLAQLEMDALWQQVQHDREQERAREQAALEELAEHRAKMTRVEDHSKDAHR